MPTAIPRDANLNLFRYGGPGAPLWAIYSVGPLQFAYKIPADQAASYDLSGLPINDRLYGSPEDSTPEWPDAINAGDISETVEVTKGFGGFAEFANYTINAFMGNNPAKNDPEVLRVLGQKIARQDMGETELQNLLKTTNWWKQRTNDQLKWNDLSPAEQEMRISEMSAQLADEWLQNVGTTTSGSDATVRHYALQVASGAMGMGQVLEAWIRKEAVRNPESPWSRKVRNEAENQRQRGVDIENQASDLRKQATRWGVPMTDSAFASWSARIVGREASAADYENYLRQQAKILYPWKDEGVATEDAAQPWLAAYSRILEKGQVDLTNPEIQRALQSGTPLFEFERQLRGRPEWLETGNARETINQQVGELGRRMGF